jgi:amino acid adenylation domain-containing protein
MTHISIAQFPAQLLAAGTIHELFSAQARSAPDAAALLTGAEAVSYAALDRQSDQLARHLHAIGVGPGDIVALLTHRSCDTVRAMLGILKAGAAYAPLDPSYPVEQLAFMAQDCAPKVVLAQAHLASVAATLGRPSHTVLELEAALEAAGRMTEAPLSSEGSEESPAYVMYTSGSTGRPKGVIVPHRGVVRLVRGQTYARFERDEVFLHLASLAFDASTFEIWSALLNGARLGILSGTHPALDDIGTAIQGYGATTVLLTTGLFHAMVDHRVEALRPLRRLLVGGDVLSPSHVAKMQAACPDCRIVNAYGPTENSVITCCFTIPKEGLGAGTVPIGMPIARTSVHILDEEMRPVPDGEVGQLCAGGEGVALGYLQRPELTSEKFVVDMFSDAPGARLYLTGDLARLRPDGNLEFLGRSDRQIKINGKRVELEEIEMSLRRDPRVADAVVIVREDVPLMKRLAGYVTRALLHAAEDEALFLAQLLQNLRSRLPAHMVPADLVLLPALPLAPSGKVDRKALPVPSRTLVERPSPQTGPTAELEGCIAEIWRRILGLDHVGTGENFFDLGGTSLQLIQVHAEIQSKIRPDIELVTLFQHPNIRDLASYLASGERSNRIATEAQARAKLQSDARRRLQQSRTRAPL